MRSYSDVPYRVLIYTVLLAICVAGCRSSDEPEEDQQVPATHTETITPRSGGSISFVMVLVPGGTFMMGSREDEPGHKDDEGPCQQVRVSRFYLCTTETTLELFEAYYEETVGPKRDDIAAGQSTGEVDAITGPTPVYGDLSMGYGKKHPAMGMTWDNAETFCVWLSKKTGRKYRLPTEAEWEYAARAGATDVFGCGNDPSRLADFAWYKANSDGELHEVGQKKSNAFGLYDVSGNVREWVSDFYSPGAYGSAANKPMAVNPSGPSGPSGGKVHVARGGDYNSPAEDLRCAARAFEESWWRSLDPQIPKSRWWLPQMDFIGFRIAESIDP